MLPLSQSQKPRGREETFGIHFVDEDNIKMGINPLAPTDAYMGRDAQLTSRGSILNIYSTNIRPEYLKHAA
jgi:hypothetical protein